VTGGVSSRDGVHRARGERVGEGEVDAAVPVSLVYRSPRIATMPSAAVAGVDELLGNSVPLPSSLVSNIYESRCTGRGGALNDRRVDHTRRLPCPAAADV